MKSLHLLRHAKSSWDDPTLPDHERPLAPRGHRASKVIARHLLERGITPELVLCSSSVRTRETLALVSAGFDPAIETRVDIEQGLYAVSAEDLLARIRRAPETIESVMLIAHNPSIQELAMELAAPARGIERIREKFPTAALATFEIADPWNAVEPGSAHLVEFVKPRELERRHR